jgi:hypothetical protein
MFRCNFILLIMFNFAYQLAAMEEAKTDAAKHTAKLLLLLNSSFSRDFELDDDLCRFDLNSSLLEGDNPASTEEVSPSEKSRKGSTKKKRRKKKPESSSKEDSSDSYVPPKKRQRNKVSCKVKKTYKVTYSKKNDKIPPSELLALIDNTDSLKATNFTCYCGKYFTKREDFRSHIILFHETKEEEISNALSNEPFEGVITMLKAF